MPPKTNKRLVVFLDVDDVLCLNSPYGGHHAKQALVQGRLCELSDKLFDATAVKHLKTVHERFHPWFVLSTSWSWVFEKEELLSVLRCCGLGFVADELHPTWTTPKNESSELRAAEIKLWISHHPEFAHSWVVLDDKESGQGLMLWPKEERAYVTLCQEGVGLQDAEARQLFEALERRLTSKA